MVRFLINKDTKILNINNEIKKLNLYKHDLELSKENIIYIYENQKGFRRFPSKIGYDYFMKTGKEPYTIF